MPVECALERFFCLLQVKSLRKEDYQIKGVHWLLQKELSPHPARWTNRRGGLLADEMGLGKTIQVLGAMMVNPLPRTLIVLPLALLEQWRGIIQKITGIAPLVYHGPKRFQISSSTMRSQRIILTTYGHIALNEDDPPSALHTIRFDRLVFDEAHHLRNERTKKHIGARALKSATTWLLTGTPIQNGLGDFYNLLRILGFTRTIVRENLPEISQQFMLRRTKEEVALDLKEVEETKCIVPLLREKMLAEDIHFLSLVEPLNGSGLLTLKPLNFERTFLPRFFVQDKLASCLPSCTRLFLIFPRTLLIPTTISLVDSLPPARFVRCVTRSSSAPATVERRLSSRIFVKKSTPSLESSEITTSPLEFTTGGRTPRIASG